MFEQHHKPVPGDKQTASPEREATMARFWRNSERWCISPGWIRLTGSSDKPWSKNSPNRKTGASSLASCHRLRRNGR
ncbi:hypothetical protein JYT23_01525 [Mariprofundus ferrooxydans]|nr:hypothetical protein [Mariprofundus ferrooxydans]